MTKATDHTSRPSRAVALSQIVSANPALAPSPALAPLVSSTRTVDRALDLLAEVCAEGALSLSEVAKRADLPVSTALRLLRTLERANFLIRGETGMFEAGTRLIQLGAAAFGRQSLVPLAQPSLQRLVHATGETAYVSKLGPGNSALYLGIVEGTHAIRHTSWVGRTVPLDGTAVGFALRDIVGDQGYVALRSAVEPDVTAIAAPIKRPGGIAGALSILGPTYRIDDVQLAEFGRLVALEAATVAANFFIGVGPSSVEDPPLVATSVHLSERDKYKKVATG
ncbi:IclR family transcriptional regulator [Nakamurella antarctica]|uniref:IclR family transcriptional regulator n=1 Tax=Nakamurella antarctica TaxID=1902245 RepID=UPI0019D07161|nr:helix-turn-helix domain-containing protein [Nakamurella antarctica]